MKRNLALLASAALLVGVVAANAQQTTPSSPSGASATQCWDVSTNSIKNQAPGSMASGSASSGSTVGSTPSGSAGSTAGSAGSSTSSSTGSGTSAATRPAGMLNC